jgi:hypothetical protein
VITVRIPVSEAEASVPRTGDGPPGPVLRALRGFSGALAVGLVVLTLVLAGAQWLSSPATVPGPGTVAGRTGILAGHGAGALIALLLQRTADRSRRVRAVAASLGVLSVVAAVLWFWWWR